MGEAPEVRGFFLGCGFNSAGKSWSIHILVFHVARCPQDISKTCFRFRLYLNERKMRGHIFGPDFEGRMKLSPALELR